MSKSELGGLPALIFQMVPHQARVGGGAPNNEDTQGVPGVAVDIHPTAPNNIDLAILPKPYMLCISDKDGGSWRAYVPGMILGRDP